MLSNDFTLDTVIVIKWESEKNLRFLDLFLSLSRLVLLHVALHHSTESLSEVDLNFFFSSHFRRGGVSLESQYDSRYLRIIEFNLIWLGWTPLSHSSCPEKTFIRPAEGVKNVKTKFALSGCQRVSLNFQFCEFWFKADEHTHCWEVHFVFVENCEISSININSSRRRERESVPKLTQLGWWRNCEWWKKVLRTSK